MLYAPPSAFASYSVRWKATCSLARPSGPAGISQESE